MRRRTKTTMVLFVPMLFLLLFAPQAGPGMLHGSAGDNGGAHVDLVVRKGTGTPARGHGGGAGRVRGEVPLRLDATPYDNFLVVMEPVILVPEGAPFPSGEESGGTAVAKNPFWFDR